MIQPILCNSNSNSTDLSVFLDSSESSYEVYIGLALLERVNIDPEDLQHKMLVGRLWNAKVKLCELHNAFGHDNRTVKKWGNALKSGNLEEMVKAFSGRSIRKKVTVEMIRYVHQLYRSRSILGHNYREKIIEKVEEVFHVKISPSLASELFKEVKTDDVKTNLETVHIAEQLTDENQDASGQEDTDLSFTHDESIQISPSFPFLTETGKNNIGAGILLRHAGLILFGLWLRLYNPLQRQIICQFLQGALNIEQSKSICHQSLRYFCGHSVSNLQEQRKMLDLESSKKKILKLYRLNNTLLPDGPNIGTIFYFDPHTKEYTGQLKIMKGWCGRRHGISKVINLDCFHTRSGRPCFIQHYSPYYDMRERFFMSLSLFDELFDEGKRKGRTFIIDRAIYGLDTLRCFDKDFVITWEKGFNGTGWDDKKATYSFEKKRKKNSKSSLRTYTFKCQESPWEKDKNFRRLIVKAQKEDSKEIIVSILCSNPAMSIEDIVWGIFNRWLQENDFKYLDVNFGINQLDSRAHSEFEEKADLFRDRPVDSPEYKKLKNNLNNAESRFARHLLTLRKKTKNIEGLKRELKICKKKRTEQQRKIEKINESQEMKKLLKRAENRLRELIKQEKSLMRKIKNASRKEEEMQNRIPLLEQEINEIAEALNSAIQKQSRIQLLIDGRYQLLDSRRKAYMDALRVNAANQFRYLHEIFRPICNNYRDDHVKLRILTRCSGFLSKSGETVKIKLWLPGTLQPHVTRNMQTLVTKTARLINDANRKKGVKNLFIELINGPIIS